MSDRNVIADDLVLDASQVAQQALAIMPPEVQRRVESMVAEGAELEVRVRLRMAPKAPQVSLWLAHRDQHVELMKAAND